VIADRGRPRLLRFRRVVDVLDVSLVVFLVDLEALRMSDELVGFIVEEVTPGQRRQSPRTSPGVAR